MITRITQSPSLLSNTFSKEVDLFFQTTQFLPDNKVKIQNHRLLTGRQICNSKQHLIKKSSTSKYLRQL